MCSQFQPRFQLSFFVAICTIVLLFETLCSTLTYAVKEDDCTSGFPSADRIHRVLSGTPITFGFADYNQQAVIPSIKFTCSGKVKSWTLAAEWVEGTTRSFIELQIWRPNGSDGLYNKVGSTIIKTEKEEERLYHHSLSSNDLAFQAGDVLGYYQSMGEMKLIFGYGSKNVYYNYPNGYLDAFNTNDSSQPVYMYPATALINAATGCSCAFVSEEKIKLEIGLDTTGDATFTSARQQITPDMVFKCDGTITKWIFGTYWVLDITMYSDLWPELQIWRNINGTYHKVDGTFLNSTREIPNQRYIYECLCDVPFKAGDILGVFIPSDSRNRIPFLAENAHGTLNFMSYYLQTQHNDKVSPFSSIDIYQHMPQVFSAPYHPLVTVEIVKKLITTAATTAPNPTTIISTHHSLLPSSTDMSTQSLVGESVAISIVIVVLLIIGVIMFVIVWKRKRKGKPFAAPTNLNSRIHLDNPVYEGTSVASPHIQQNDGDDTRPSIEYSLVGHSDSTNETRVLDNPLYSHMGPVTNQETSNHSCTSAPRELAQTTMSSPNTIYYVSNAVQQQRQQMEQCEDDPNNYSALAVGKDEVFQEKDVYWAPASTVTGIYEQLSYHKYREICSENIQVGGSLGSGEFGVALPRAYACAIT